MESNTTTPDEDDPHMDSTASVVDAMTDEDEDEE